MTHPEQGVKPAMNLIEAIQERCNYIRDTIIPEYVRIGPAGSIGKMLLQNDILNAESIIAHGDVVQMIEALRMLRETCERAL